MRRVLALVALVLVGCASGETGFCPNLEPSGPGAAAVDSSGRGLPGVQCSREVCGAGLECLAGCGDDGSCFRGRGACTKECRCHSDCAPMGAGFRCGQSLVCIKTCRVDSDCPAGSTCLNGVTCGPVRCDGLETQAGPMLRQVGVCR